jgi:hypothetical protein
MRTTGLRSLINTPVTKNDKCDGSNQSPRLNDSSRSTVLFKICFESVDTTSRRSIIDCSEKELSPTGER